MLENDRTWKQDYLYRMFSHHTKGKAVSYTHLTLPTNSLV